MVYINETPNNTRHVIKEIILKSLTILFFFSRGMENAIKNNIKMPIKGKL